MEAWLVIFIITISISVLIKVVSKSCFQSKKQSLPPGPFNFPIIRNLLWLWKSFTDLEPIIRSVHKDLGPIITLYISSRPSIFITDHSLSHQALVQNSAVFADRPRDLAANNIGMSTYGSTWRLFRRNLTSEILHPSRLKSYSQVRKWALGILFNSLAKSGDEPVLIGDHFQYALFSLLVFMCFGDELEPKEIEEIQRVEYAALVNIDRFAVLNFWPKLSKILFRKRWSEFLQLEKEREDVIIPMIIERKKVKQERLANQKTDDDDYILSYVDTLLDLQLPDEKRKLTDKEILILCDEFLNAASDSTSTAFHWIMANLVKYPYTQERLFMEIKSVVSDGEKEVKEDDLQKMPYLKAVILEGLRRHPPVHFLLPHAVTEDVYLGKHLIPKNADVNFMVADMGWDPNVWEDPMAFKPERFIGESDGEMFDITGSKEIKMMPFGAGRRICPGHGFALFHLEYFVANLVWKFEWKAIDGDDVDLSERLDFTVAMKNPLQAHVSPRFK